MNSLGDLLASLTPQARKELLAQLERDEMNPLADAVVLHGGMGDVIGRRASDDAPLSYAQRGLWFLNQLRPEDIAYNVCYAIEWAEELDLAALRAALNDLTDRHEILRTVIPAPGGEPRQVILPSLPVPLEEVSLACDDSAGEDKWTQSAATQPFDLKRGPLLRAMAIRRGGRHTLVLAVHHIIYDATSTPILLRELVRLYDARVSAQPPGLPDLPVQFADFAAWQRDGLAGDALDAHRVYWRAKLDGLRPLALSADRQRSNASRSAGAMYPFNISDRLRASLVAVGGAHYATLFMVLLAGFVALLHRYSGRDDIAVGTSVTLRDRPELEALIGFFLNTLVLRTKLPADVTFGQLIELVQDTVLDAFEHKDMPFELLVEDLAPERSLGAMPLVPVLFEFSGTGPAASSGGGASKRVVTRSIPGHGARADLTLAFSDLPRGLRGNLEYDLALFDADSMERMCGHFLRLLEAGAERPDVPVRRLPIVTEAEEAELASWNATIGPAAAITTLTDMVRRQARLTPGKTAVRDDATHLRYADLDERSERVALWLRDAGIACGRPVGVLLPRGADQVIALAGVLKAGGAYLPLDPAYPAERLSFIQADAGAEVVITRSDLVSPAAGRTLLIDKPWRPPDAAPAQWSEPVHPDQPAYILYTSGSTGLPKGVVNTHRGLINRLGWMAEAFGAGPNDVILYKTPMSFDVSLWELVLPPMTGAEMVVARPDGHMDPGYLADLIEQHGVTMIHFVPSMLRAFLAAADPARCRTLRQVLCSGEALTTVLRDRFFDAGLSAALDNLYGPTEAAIDVTRWSCAAGQSGEVPIGHPILNTQVYVLDDNGEQLPVGASGELWLGGDQLALGYVGRPGLTAASFAPDPFHPEPGRRLYRTGDIARRRPDGAIEYLGRTDQQVKLRGHRIELTEIEIALRSHESVSDAVVLLANPGSDAKLAAYVVAGNQVPTSTELREHLGHALPAYMVPTSYAFVEHIPLTANGKADRNALRAITAVPVRAALFVEPRDDVEIAVASLFTELTDAEKISIYDDFFQIGGHSLLALRLRAALVSKFGIDLPLSEIFEEPTVEAVADKIIRQVLQCVDAAEIQADGDGSGTLPAGADRKSM